MKQTVKLYAAPATEAQHQHNVIAWSEIHRAEYPDLKMLFHIPNGGSRDVREAARLKDQGVRPGVPDLFLPAPRDRYHGLFLELKRPGGRTTGDQAWWVEQLTGQGYFCDVCRGWENAVRVLAWYLSL